MSAIVPHPRTRRQIRPGGGPPVLYRVQTGTAPTYHPEPMGEPFICDAARTPIGRYGGALSAVRTDDLAAVPIAALLARNPSLEPAAIEEVLLGCANQAGEDNRNVARMASLLAGLPVSVPGATINRLCGSGLDAVAMAARIIRAGEAQVVVAGGVESMSRAPFVMPKADAAFSRSAEIHDTTLGWRFVNPRMRERYGVDSMPETGENVAAQFNIARADQDRFALRSQQRTADAYARGFYDAELVAVEIARAKGKVLSLARLTLEQLQVIELNEAFASQALALLRDLKIPDDASHVNPNGGAIALGHPLGMSGARLATSATWQLAAVRGRYALC